jgi:sugar (pentulose or hexulose) kinase
MIDQDRKPFAKLMSGVYGFYGKDTSDFSLDVWWQAMSPFDFEAVRDALNRHCVNPDSGQFLPKPADVVKMLGGSTVDAALVAWSKVDRAVREVGTYRSVAFDDPVIHRVITDMGGWVALGAKDEEAWPFVRNEFVNRYRGFRMRSEIPEYLPLLVGIAEASNSKAGFGIERPMLIGDAEAARAVLAGGSNKPLLGVTQLLPVGPKPTKLRLAGGAA